MAVFFKTLDTNEALRKATHGVKIIAGIDFPEAPEKLKEVLLAKANNTRVPPPIVISATVGKENAQFLLNTVYELFKDVKGADIELEGNMEVTKFIQIAGGNFNEKEKRPEYFDDNLIFYRSNFLSKKNPQYHGLINPNKNSLKSILPPENESEQLQISNLLNLHEEPQDKGKEKEEKYEDDFFTMESTSEDSLWTEKKLKKLKKLPFGRFLAAEIHSRNNPDNKKNEELRNILATMPMSQSFHEDINALQANVIHNDNQINLAFIDDEEWNILSHTPNPEFKNYQWKSKIINPQKKENGIITFFLIHGTFVDSTEFGKDNDTKMSKDLINTSKMLALDNGCAVKVVSFQWSGELSARSRKEAASILKEYFTTDQDCMNAHQTIAFSHSFGGDVLLQFANLLKPHNKTIDLAVMVATPAGEATKLERVKKDARMLKYTDPEECFNAKRIIQCFSRGDGTQAAGSRQMTLGFFNPIGTAERRLPLRISDDRTIINCHFEHNGNLCSHVDIKWHVAASMHLFLPMIQNLYPHAHDLNIATCDDNKQHLPIITLRNPIFSVGSETTQHRSHLASVLGEQMFEELYKKKIGTNNTWTLLKFFAEAKHAGYSQKDQGREKQTHGD